MMVSAGEATILRRENERTWAETATVYRRTVGGQYATVAKSGLRCSLSPLGRQRENASSLQDRASLTPLRVLKWDYTYTMPANAQLEIDGRRWNVRDDTIELRKARPGSEPLYWIADVVRQP